MMRGYSDAAIALFDGGWRAADRDCLEEEYNLGPDVLDSIVEDLQAMENDPEIKQ